MLAMSDEGSAAAAGFKGGEHRVHFCLAKDRMIE